MTNFILLTAHIEGVTSLVWVITVVVNYTNQQHRGTDAYAHRQTCTHTYINDGKNSLIPLSTAIDIR